MTTADRPLGATIPGPFFPPPRPGRSEPIVVPVVDLPFGEGPRDDVQARLWEQRTILVSGVLDGAQGARVSVELMALDGRSSGDVEILINSSGGPVEVVFSVLDVIALMRARVNVTCVGAARGTAAALVACCTGERRAAPHARLSLRCEDTQAIDGSAAEIERQAEELVASRRRLVDIVAAACGQPVDRIGNEVDGGSPFDAQEAVDLGLVDVIVDRRTRGSGDGGGD